MTSHIYLLMMDVSKNGPILLLGANASRNMLVKKSCTNRRANVQGGSPSTRWAPLWGTLLAGNPDCRAESCGGTGSPRTSISPKLGQRLFNLSI